MDQRREGDPVIRDAFLMVLMLDVGDSVDTLSLSLRKEKEASFGAYYEMGVKLGAWLSIAAKGIKIEG